METQFINAFKEALEFEEKDVKLTDKFREYPEWDSLSRLSLIAMLDDQYDVQIEDTHFKTLESIQDLIDYVKNNK